MSSAIKDGDLIFTSQSDFVSGVINLGTLALPAPLPGHGCSHVGIVAKYGLDPLVYESTTFGRPECVLQGREVRGVQAHRLEDYIRFGHRVWHYPLKRALYEHEIQRLRYLLDRSLGTPYDLVGAVRSGGLAYRTLQSVLRREDLASVFCSEFVADVLARVGVWSVRNAGSWNPNRLARALRRRGIVDRPVRLDKEK